MKITIFLFKILSKYTPKRINRKMFLKISSRELSYSKHVSKIFIFYIKKMVFLKKYL